MNKITADIVEHFIANVRKFEFRDSLVVGHYYLSKDHQIVRIIEMRQTSSTRISSGNVDEVNYTIVDEKFIANSGLSYLPSGVVMDKSNQADIVSFANLIYKIGDDFLAQYSESDIRLMVKLWALKNELADSGLTVRYSDMSTTVIDL